jgi:hypothetical protein
MNYKFLSLTLGSLAVLGVLIITASNSTPSVEQVATNTTIEENIAPQVEVEASASSVTHNQLLT